MSLSIPNCFSQQEKEQVSYHTITACNLATILADLAGWEFVGIFESCNAIQ